MARRRRGTPGAVPRMGQALWRGVRWCAGHPQPVIACGVAVACLWAFWECATRSEAFRITDVQVPANSALNVPASSLIGRNLWTVDLDALAAQLHAQQPFLKRLRVIRVLPNTLQVQVEERIPVAQVHLGGWHAVDREGFILPQASSAPRDRLVTLTGVEHPSAPLKVGRENTSERLLRALRLVERLSGSRVLAGHRLTQVDVADPQQLSFALDEGLDIRCGSEDSLSAHLQRLRAVLQRVAKHPLEIRYIDVRFRDPVIGPRT